jgi:hypothetical protein
MQTSGSKALLNLDSPRNNPQSFAGSHRSRQVVYLFRSFESNTSEWERATATEVCELAKGLSYSVPKGTDKSSCSGS